MSTNTTCEKGRDSGLGIRDSDQPSPLPLFRIPNPESRIPAPMTLSTGYDPQTFESRLYAQWESSGVFAPAGAGPAYTLLLPPPTLPRPPPLGPPIHPPLTQPPD